LVTDLSDENSFHVVMPMKIWYIIINWILNFFFNLGC
jgi:hypothetical protein